MHTTFEPLGAHAFTCLFSKSPWVPTIVALGLQREHAIFSEQDAEETRKAGRLLDEEAVVEKKTEK